MRYFCALMAFVFEPKGYAIEGVVFAFDEGFEVVFWDGYVVAGFEFADDFYSGVDCSTGYYIERVAIIGLCPFSDSGFEVCPNLLIKPT